MLYKKLLVTGTLSTLLLASTLFAQENCVGGVCFVNLDDLKPTKSFNHSAKQEMVVIETPRYVETNMEPVDNMMVEAIESRKVDKTFDVLMDNELVTVFPSYVMTDSEKRAYIQEQRAIALNEKFNAEANRELRQVGQAVERIEDAIINKTQQELPSSDYYCDDNRKAVYHNESHSFERV